MISLDWSIVPAILIFIVTIIALNYLLFRPVLKVQAERERRTSGLMAQTRKDLDHHLQLFDQYQATIKNARMEGYRSIEKARSEAMITRDGLLQRGRDAAEQLLAQARTEVQQQIVAAKAQLGAEAQDIARRIASTILQRSA
jgi:F-type H+-transporting ATPase subunit b